MKSKNEKKKKRAREEESEMKMDEIDDWNQSNVVICTKTNYFMHLNESNCLWCYEYRSTENQN